MTRSSGISLALWVTLSAPAMACDPPPLEGGERVDGARFVAVLRAEPFPPPLNAAFAMEIAVCARDGSPPPPPRLDAWMPAHRHGMNYRPTLTTLGAGRHRAEGLLFHMAGRWEFLVDIDGERLTAPRDIE